ncbi:terminase small subunit [Polaromonas sp.]|uniref:terminase small subunit n=1 Tax=Polaromonas sp. TaxID=1869339 RepID=UPI00326709B2
MATTKKQAPKKKPAPRVAKAAAPKAKPPAKGWKLPTATKAPKPVKAPVPVVVKVEGGEALMDLTPKQEAFCLAYIECGNASKAYRQVYDAKDMLPGTVWSSACLLLQNPKVAARVRFLKDQASALILLTKADVLAEAMRLATFDIRKLYDDHGSPIPIHELDPDTAACLLGVDVLEEFEGQGKDRKFIGYTKKYKTGDKKGALEMLFKHFGLYEVDNQQKTDPLRELLKAMGGKSAFPVVKDAPT